MRWPAASLFFPDISLESMIKEQGAVFGTMAMRCKKLRAHPCGVRPVENTVEG
jgi:hypothetical protein